MCVSKRERECACVYIQYMCVRERVCVKSGLELKRKNIMASLKMAPAETEIWCFFHVTVEKGKENKTFFEEIFKLVIYTYIQKYYQLLQRTHIYIQRHLYFHICACVCFK